MALGEGTQDEGEDELGDRDLGEAQVEAVDAQSAEADSQEVPDVLGFSAAAGRRPGLAWVCNGTEAPQESCGRFVGGVVG